MANWASDDRVRFLEELVKINSGSTHHQGVLKVQNCVARELKKLGFQVSWIPHPDGKVSSGQLLMGTWEWKTKSVKNQKKTKPRPFIINLVTHEDTVFELDSGFHQFELNEKQEIAVGPGVIDDKGGIVIALEGVRRFIKKVNSLKRVPPLVPQIRLICTPSEELGSPGFSSQLKSLGYQSALTLGFEPSMEDGSIIESRKGNLWLKLEVWGREGHAGRDYLTSVNAATELVHKLTQISSISDPKKQITVNIGQLGGGTKFNIICGYAFAKIDVRFPNFRLRKLIDQKIQKIISTPYIGENLNAQAPEARVILEDDCPPLEKTKKSKNLIQRYIRTIESIEGRKINSVPSGGAADLNFMSFPESIMMDGLGAVGGGMHRKDEFIHLWSLETRSEALARFLESFTDKAKSEVKLLEQEV